MSDLSPVHKAAWHVGRFVPAAVLFAASLAVTWSAPGMDLRWFWAGYLCCGAMVLMVLASGLRPPWTTSAKEPTDG